jgi:phage terminase small subunit
VAKQKALSTVVDPELITGKQHKSVTKMGRQPTHQEKVFIYNIVHHRMPQLTALQAAGITPLTKSKLNKIMSKPWVKEYLAIERAEYARASMMTKKKVMDGMLEAIEMAKLKSDPLTMISGWREVGKLCWFYAPTRTEIMISSTALNVSRQLEQMTDQQLLQLTGEELNVIDAEFRTVCDSTTESEGGEGSGRESLGEAQATPVYEEDVSDLSAGMDSPGYL